MRSRRVASLVLSLAVAGTLVLQGTSGSAAPTNVTCELAGTVTLASPTEFANALNNPTSGSFGNSTGVPDTSAKAVCVSDDLTRTGVASLTGTFTFCEHNLASCTINTEVHAHDTVGALIPVGGVVADFKGGPATIDWGGGVTCGLKFWGHAVVAQAEIAVAMNCGNNAAFNVNGVGTALGVPIPLVDSAGCGAVGGTGADCFKQVIFTGNVTAVAP